MPVIDKPVPTYPLEWLKRTGATDGIVKEDWTKPVKSAVKPRSLPRRTDNSYVAPAPFKFSADHKASNKKTSSVAGFLAKLFWGYIYLSVFGGLLSILISALR